MGVYIQKSHKTIKFIVFGTLCKRIFDWQRSMDEIVFNEQLKTGSFHGKFPMDDEDILSIMHQFKKEGKVLPYYGAGGGRGSCVYKIQVNNPSCNIAVKNTAVGVWTKFQEEPIGNSKNFVLRSKIWIALNSRFRQILEPFFTLMIDGKELQNLKNWEFWDEERALTPKFIYSFGQVSLGRLGYSIEVKNTENGEEIDINDYTDW